ncbi:hypothetical protein EGI26_11090 [Lacihabitans sp. CCS-44]|nr:hypothetical protein [Lacihabitans sp. CCS-44]
MHIMNTIGKEIEMRFGRIKPNIPQNIYNDTLMIPKKTFGKYIRNESQPRLDELERIAKWLNKNPKDLF